MASPDPVKYAEAKRRLLKGLRKIVANCEQLVADIAWWNANRLDAAPFDSGGDLVAAQLGRQLIALIEHDEMIPDPLWDRLNAQLESNARR
jgi:hypothetical protein